MLQWCTITYTELNYLLNSNLKYKTTATCSSWMSNEMLQKEMEIELYFELFILCSINRIDQYNFWGCSWEMLQTKCCQIILPWWPQFFITIHSSQNGLKDSFLSFVSFSWILSGTSRNPSCQNFSPHSRLLSCFPHSSLKLSREQKRK